MAWLLFALHLGLLACKSRGEVDLEACGGIKASALLQRPQSHELHSVVLAAVEDTEEGGGDSFVAAEDMDFDAADETEEGSDDSVEAVEETEEDADDSFEAARPGSCCPEEPSTHVLWSEFATSAAVQEAQSQGAPVVVPCGHEVTVDQSVAGLHGLRVLGSLKFQEGVDVVLETDHLLVCGNFSIGSQDGAHVAQVEIVLTGSTEVQWPTSEGGGGKNFGKAPFATYGGGLYLRGAACGAGTWTRLSASVAPASNHVVNVALNKPAAMSSLGHWRYRAYKGVDGGTNWKGQSVLTRREANPWWYVQVDSLAQSGVDKVLLTRRHKGSDLSTVVVGVASVACQVGTLCGGSVCPYQGQTAGKHEFDCGGATGAFIYVQLQGQSQLSFAEAQVFPSTAESEYDLSLQDGPPLSWKAGDRLMIAATGYSAEETEEVTVVHAEPGLARVSGKLRFGHAGCNNNSEPGCVVAAEVASLSRNVVIRGRNSCAPVCGHFMLAHTNHGFICGAEFTNLGQTAVEGRYPLHIHLPGSAPDLVVKDNALHDNHNRGLVLHGVHDMTASYNTCYKTKGHCFMTEDGVEQHNWIIGNLGVLVSSLSFGCSATHDMTFTCPHRSDTSPNAFWISNPNNFFDKNVGITTGGAFFIETRHVMGLVRRKFRSEAMKVGHNGQIKGRVPLGQFTNNLAHSCGTGLGNYPRVTYTAGGRNAYEGFTAWRCGIGMGAHTGGGTVQIRQAYLFQNIGGVRAGLASASIAVSESRMVARPGWEHWNKGSRYTSAPLTVNRMGKTTGGYIRGAFTLDNFTRNWVRCHGSYDPEALRALRGDWFALFEDPSNAHPCSAVPSQ